MRTDHVSESIAVPLAGYARTLWLFKVCSIALIVSLIFNFGQLILTYSLFPLVRKEPVYVEFQTGGNNFVRVVHTDEIKSRLDTLTSVALRSFVVDRETIDQLTERNRYKRVLFQSSSNVEATFRKMYGGKNSLVNEKNFHRQVIVRRDGPLAKNIHQLEFESRDYYDNRDADEKGGINKPIINEWVATIGYRYINEKIAYDEQHLNPLGLQVTKYNLSKRSITSKRGS